MRERYAPRNLIVAAAGAVDHEEIVRMTEDRFGHLSEIATGETDPGVFRGGECRVEKGLEQAHVALAFASPGYRDDAVYASQVFSMTMGGGMSSRLFQEAREKRGLCYSIFAQTSAYSDSGLLTIYAGTSSEEVDDLISLTVDELRRSVDDLAEAEVARARAQLKAGMLMGLESPAGRVERLARLLAIWDQVPGIEEIVEKIDAVDLARVRTFAGGIADSGAAALALYGPVSRAPSVDEVTETLAA